MQKLKFFVNKLPQTIMTARAHFYLLAVLLYSCIHQGSALCPPTPFEPGFHCYFIPEDPQTWDDAKRHCLEYGAALAYLPTRKRIMLGVKASYRDRQEVWIGGQSSGGKFKWSSPDTEVAAGMFTTAGSSAPAGPSGANDTKTQVQDGLCLVLNADSEFAGASCSEKKHYLCEYAICSPGCKELNSTGNAKSNPNPNPNPGGGADANATKGADASGGGELEDVPTCDLKTLKCKDGCQQGYTGDECFLITRPKCPATCKNCSDGLTCDGGCKDGWVGADCQLACRCFPSSNSSSCPVMSKCDAGCVAGFHGVECEKVCSEGCAGDTSCDQTTATCNNGCMPPYTGPACNNEEGDVYERKTTASMVKGDLSTTSTTEKATPISEYPSSENPFTFSRPDWLMTTPLYSKSEPGDSKSREVLGFITIGSITGISIVVIFIVVVNVFYNKKNEKKPEEPAVDMAQQPEEEKALEALKSSTSV